MPIDMGKFIFGVFMKKLILVILLLQNIFALDSVSSIPKEQKKVLSQIVETLKMPSNSVSRNMIYDYIGFSFKDGWSAHWTTNSTGKNSKISNSDVQICDVTIYNNNRVVNATFVHFKKKNQLFITTKEYIEAESSLVLQRYKNKKADSKYSIINETDNYAYFQQNGYMTYETYHIKSPVGMVVYESSYILDVAE